MLDWAGGLKGQQELSYLFTDFVRNYLLLLFVGKIRTNFIYNERFLLDTLSKSAGVTSGVFVPY